MTEEQWKLIFEALESVDDAGPPDEGWQSDELQSAILALRKLREGRKV